MQRACDAQVQSLQKAHEERSLAGAAAAGVTLARHKEAAAAALAAREAALQQQLDSAVAAAKEERQRLEEQSGAAAAAAAARWDALCAQLAGKLRQLSENLALDPQTVQLSPEDAQICRAPSDDHPPSASSSGLPTQGSPAAAGAAEALPACMAEVHAGLSQLYAAALEVRGRYSAARAQAAALQAEVEGARRAAAEQQQEWEERLERELRQVGVQWDLRAAEQVAAAVAEGRSRLAAAEDRLQGELAQVTRTLAAAQHRREELEQQCSGLAAELLAAQQAAAEGLEAAASRAAAQQSAAAQEAAAALAGAAERQAEAEAQLRQEMAAALEHLGEQHAGMLAAAEAAHRQRLEEAGMLAEQAEQHHKQVGWGGRARYVLWEASSARQPPESCLAC